MTVSFRLNLISFSLISIEIHSFLTSHSTFDKYSFIVLTMGRAQQFDSDDDRISPEPELPLVHKKKGIQKAKLRKLTPKTKLGPQKVKTPKVGLSREELSLEAKQTIFNKVVGDLSGKKVRRKDKKKQRYLIKKGLRKEIDQRMPPSKQQAAQPQKMQEEGKVTVRREKFKEGQAISQFKASMGLGLGSIRQRMLEKQ